MIFGLLVFGCLILCFLVGWFIPYRHSGFTYYDPGIYTYNNSSRKLDEHMMNIKSGLYDRLNHHQPSTFTCQHRSFEGIIAEAQQPEKADKT